MVFGGGTASRAQQFSSESTRRHAVGAL